MRDFSFIAPSKAPFPHTLSVLCLTIPGFMET